MWNGSDYDIHTVNQDGSGLDTLIASPASGQEPGLVRGRTDDRVRQDATRDSIFVAKFDGSEERPVAQGTNPAWSPEGDKLVFVRSLEDPGLSVVTVAEGAAGAGAAVPLTQEEDFDPEWSPDGERIAFCRREPVGDDFRSFLWVINADGSGAHRVNTPAGVICRLTWSPTALSCDPGISQRPRGHVRGECDDRHLALRREPERAGNDALLSRPGVVAGRLGHRVHRPGCRCGDDFVLRTANAQTGAIQLVFQGPSVQDPAWQPIAQLVNSVEFTQGIQELQSLGAMEASLGGSATRAGGVGAQAFPGDNGKIAYVSLDAPPGVHTMNPDGSGDTFISAGGYPAFSPDGKKIAYHTTQIFVANSDGSDPVPVTAIGSDIYPAWSPDGDQLAFMRLSNGSQALWVMNSDGSDQHLIFDSGRRRQSDLSADLGARWEPDCLWLLDRREEPGTVCLWWVRHLQRPDERLRTQVDHRCGRRFHGGCIAGRPDDCLHGRSRMAVPRIHDGINGNGIQQVGATGGEYPAWSPDGGSIVFTLLPEDQGADKPLAVMNVDGSGLKILHPHVREGVDWQAVNPPLVNRVEFTQGVQDLQTVSALQSDLEGDGMPPVPIVAGKPAAMRIYMSEVEETTVYEVEATGDVNGSRFVQLDPGCTPADDARTRATADRWTSCSRRRRATGT